MIPIDKMFIYCTRKYTPDYLIEKKRVLYNVRFPSRQRALPATLLNGGSSCEAEVTKNHLVDCSWLTVPTHSQVKLNNKIN